MNKVLILITSFKEQYPTSTLITSNQVNQFFNITNKVFFVNVINN